MVLLVLRLSFPELALQNGVKMELRICSSLSLSLFLSCSVISLFSAHSPFLRRLPPLLFQKNAITLLGQTTRPTCNLLAEENKWLPQLLAVISFLNFSFRKVPAGQKCCENCCSIFAQILLLLAARNAAAFSAQAHLHFTEELKHTHSPQMNLFFFNFSKISTKHLNPR